MAVQQTGELRLEGADDANIPVSLFIEWDNISGQWTLTAGNYMPRKGRVAGDAYEAHADSREELVALIAKHVLPLYRTAVLRLEAMVSGDADDCYYWWMNGLPDNYTPPTEKVPPSVRVDAVESALNDALRAVKALREDS